MALGYRKTQMEWSTRLDASVDISTLARPEEVLTRIKEHKAACRLAQFKRSAVAELAWQDGHIIEWDQAEIMDMVASTSERLIKEVIYIKMVLP